MEWEYNILLDHNMGILWEITDILKNNFVFAKRLNIQIKQAENSPTQPA